jgi:hypothetical protein
MARFHQLATGTCVSLAVPVPRRYVRALVRGSSEREAADSSAGFAWPQQRRPETYRAISLYNTGVWHARDACTR